jgi:hypothetical protein
MENLQANNLVANSTNAKSTLGAYTLKEKTITGQITDEKGEGLPGASVAVKGTVLVLIQIRKVILPSKLMTRKRLLLW